MYEEFIQMSDRIHVTSAVKALSLDKSWIFIVGFIQVFNPYFQDSIRYFLQFFCFTFVIVNPKKLGELEEHKKTKHTEILHYECSFCAKKFNHRRSMKRHEHTHTNIRNYGCEFCGKTFIVKDKLDVHRRLHTGDVLKLLIEALSLLWYLLYLQAKVSFKIIWNLFA